MSKTEMEKAFLKKVDLLALDQERVKEQFCRIAVYDWEETELIDNIDGYVTGGTVNYNGNSVVRRTCSPSIVVPQGEEDIINVEKAENLLSANKKVIIYVGFTNTLGAQCSLDKDSDYTERVWVEEGGNGIQTPRRIWFKLGVYLIKSASVSRSTSGLNISLTLSDKMSLLNGDVAGFFPATTTLSEISEYDDSGDYITTKATIREILTTTLTDIGGLVVGRDIQDLEKLKKAIPDYVTKVVKWGDAERDLIRTMSNGGYFFDTIDTSPQNTDTGATFQYGETVGFLVEPYIWPGEKLTANPGDTITSILDKIKNLNNYEYFFDIDGKFVWQKKDIYEYGKTDDIDEETFFKDTKTDGDGIVTASVASIIIPCFDDDKKNIAYEFTDANLMTSYSNSPQYNSIKNDIIVWGKRHTAAGSEIPVRYRIQIREPIEYNEDIDTNIDCVPYISYVGSNEEKFYGYRKLKADEQNSKAVTFSFNGNTDWRTLLYFRGIRDSEGKGNWSQDPLYRDLIQEWPKLFEYKNEQFKLRDGLSGDTIDYYCHIIEDNNISYEKLKKWHTKVLNEDSIGAIFTPGVATDYITCVGDNYIKAQENLESAFTYAGIENTNDCATINVSKDIYYSLYTSSSTDTNSAFEQARQLITQCTGYANTISISAIPIYHLEPNTLIKVRDPKWVLDEDSKKNNTNVQGTCYCINSISLPLAYNGTMTISASKALISA